MRLAFVSLHSHIYSQMRRTVFGLCLCALLQASNLDFTGFFPFILPFLGVCFFVLFFFKYVSKLLLLLYSTRK